MNRRSFMRTFAAAGIATPLATMRTKAAPVQDKLPVPAGKIFEGMGGGRFRDVHTLLPHGEQGRARE